MDLQWSRNPYCFFLLSIVFDVTAVSFPDKNFAFDNLCNYFMYLDLTDIHTSYEDETRI